MFLKTGSEYHLRRDDDVTVYPDLPAGNYVVKFNPFQKQYYLVKTGDFELPKKIYGSATTRANRIINTFFDRSSSTGVLLTGEKGSGKTMLAKEISCLLAKGFSVPTIMVNENFSGEEFSQFLAGITQPVVVFFDEFEKIYNWQDQSKLLTILDGTHSTRKLFLVTCNKTDGLSEFMQNRPGRFYYSISYTGLEEDFIRDYAEDNLNQKDQIDNLVKVSKTFGSFTFDILKSIIEEMNRYNENVYDAMELLNTKPDFGRGETYGVVVYYRGDKLAKDQYSPGEYKNINIISDTKTIFLTSNDSNEHHRSVEDLQNDGVVEEDDGYYSFDFSPANLTGWEISGDIVYKVGDYKVVLEKVEKFKFNWRAL